MTDSTWGVDRPDPVGDMSNDSFDIDFSSPILLTEVTLGGGRGPSSPPTTPSPLLLKLVGRDLLGESEGVRMLPPFLLGTVGGLSTEFYQI